jgi:hypothetical protein
MITAGANGAEARSTSGLTKKIAARGTAVSIPRDN